MSLSIIASTITGFVTANMLMGLLQTPGVVLSPGAFWAALSHSSVLLVYYAIVAVSLAGLVISALLGVARRRPRGAFAVAFMLISGVGTFLGIAAARASDSQWWYLASLASSLTAISTLIASRASSPRSAP